LTFLKICRALYAASAIAVSIMYGLNQITPHPVVQLEESRISAGINFFNFKAGANMG
jgi:hypothetical protein